MRGSVRSVQCHVGLRGDDRPPRSVPSSWVWFRMYEFDGKRKRIIPPVHRHDDADQWTAIARLHRFILVLFQAHGIRIPSLTKRLRHGGHVRGISSGSFHAAMAPDSSPHRATQVVEQMARSKWVVQAEGDGDGFFMTKQARERCFGLVDANGCVVSELCWGVVHLFQGASRS